jgi:hypothetical protein
MVGLGFGVGLGLGDKLIKSFIDDNIVIRSDCQDDERGSEACCQDQCESVLPSPIAAIKRGYSVFFECSKSSLYVLFGVIIGLVLLSWVSSFMETSAGGPAVTPGTESLFDTDLIPKEIPNKPAAASEISSGTMIIGIILLIIAIFVIIGLSGYGPLQSVLSEYEYTMSLLRELYSEVVVGTGTAPVTECGDVTDATLDTCNQTKCRYYPAANGNGPSCHNCDEVFTGEDKESSLLDTLESNSDTIIEISEYILAYSAYKVEATGVKKMMNGVVKKIIVKPSKVIAQVMKKTLEKWLLRVAERQAARVAARGAEEVALGGASVAVEVATGGLATPLVAAVDEIMMIGFAADIVDEAAYRSYISNEENILPKRNSVDGNYIKGLFGITNEKDEIPPIQGPSVYPLYLLIDTFKDTRFDEAMPFKIIGESYTEALLSYSHYLLEILTNANASPSPLLVDLYNIFKTKEEDTTYNVWCTHESELMEAYQNMVNYNPTERDNHIYKYIQSYMEKGAISATEFKAGVERNENIWDKVLPANSVLIITSGLEHGQLPGDGSQWKYSDLIKNYNVGTDKIEGVSLTEAGCILLNQVLNWDSHFWESDLLSITGGIPPADPSQLRAVKKHAVDLAKVTFIDSHRELTGITNPGGADTPDEFTLITKDNSTIPLYLPQYYPSHALVETVCLLGINGMKLMNNTDSGLSTLDILGRGDGLGGGSGVQESWLPILYGVSYDDKMGLCKYETDTAKLTNSYNTGGETYCTRMGRSGFLQNKESPTSPAKFDYNTCDDTCDTLCTIGEWTIGEEFTHTLDRMHIEEIVEELTSSDGRAAVAEQAAAWVEDIWDAF